MSHKAKEKAVVQAFSGHNNGKKHLTVLIELIVKTMKKLPSCFLQPTATMKIDYPNISMSFVMNVLHEFVK